MEELIKLLDENLQYPKNEIKENIIYIYVISARNEVVCPFYGTPPIKIHSR